MGLTTFATALSGLASNSQALNVVGNNLANLNTVGFKASSINFTEVLGQTFGAAGTSKSGNIMHVGRGSQVAAVRSTFSQGSAQTTSNPLDVAIQGKGFLVLGDGGGKYFTRAGNLHLDADGFLVAENGYRVQGYVKNAATGKVDTNLGLQDLKIPNSLEQPVTTSQFELTMNLDSSALVGTQFTTSVQIFDSLGTAHLATITLQKDVTGGTPTTTKWDFDITIPRNEIAGIPASNTDKLSLITGAVSTTPTAGTLVFDSVGELVSAYIGPDPATLPALANLKVPPTSVTLPALANGAVFDANGITWKLVNDDTSPNITGFTSASEVTFSDQNGTGAGSLNNLTIQSDGTLAAVFNNGKTTSFAQIALAQFSNLDGLMAQGGGLYVESPASGASFIGPPGEGGRGQLLSGSLEQSNVDMATELTKIITFQRGYQANAKLISVTDQILQETMNMRS
jgi:flagellar hook protein FlgE